MRRIDNKLLELIINEIKRNDKITEKELSFRYKYTERTLRRYFKILKDNNIIKLNGAGKKRTWKIIRHVQIK